MELIDTIFEGLSCQEEQTRAVIRMALADISLFDSKQHDYGPSNISKFGETGVLVRISDKVERLINLNKAGIPEHESIDDTWQDLSIYGVIARVVRNGDWL